MCIKSYVSKCAQCRKVHREPKENPIYVVRLDKYFCDDNCWNLWRKAEKNQ